MRLEKVGKGCIGDARNPISLKDKQPRRASAVLLRSELVPGYPCRPPFVVFWCTSFEAGDDCQSVVARHPFYPWSHGGLMLFVVLLQSFGSVRDELCAAIAALNKES